MTIFEENLCLFSSSLKLKGMELYFKFIQTVGALIVKAVRIDTDKDGKVSKEEVTIFLIQSLLPLLSNIGGLRDEANAFFKHVKELTLEKFIEDLRLIVDENVLPEDARSAEIIVDGVAGSLKKIIEGSVELVETIKDALVKGEDDNVGIKKVELPKVFGVVKKGDFNK